MKEVREDSKRWLRGCSFLFFLDLVFPMFCVYVLVDVNCFCFFFVFLRDARDEN